MKFIDANGRIFGKVNIIHFLIIVFFIASLPVVYFTMQLHKRFTKQSFIKNETIELKIAAKIIKLSPESSNALKVGDKEYDKNGTVIAEIISLGETKPYVHRIMFDSENGEDVYDPVLLERPAHIKLRAQINGDSCYYKGSLVGYNYPLYFVFNNKTYAALATKETKTKALTAKETKTKEIWVPVKIGFSKVSPEITKMLENNYYEFDRNGKIMAKLYKIISVKPSPRDSARSRRKPSVLNDVTVTGELVCTERNGSFFYNNMLLQIGSKINLTTNLFLTGEIIEIEK